MKILTLHLKRKWWEQIESGDKLVELRLQTEYWRKRLVGQHYDEVHLLCGYPSRAATNKVLRRQWRAVTSCQVTHEEFGPDPVSVYSIDVSGQIRP